MTSLYQTASDVPYRQNVTFRTITAEELDVDTLAVDNLTIYNSISAATGSIPTIGSVSKPFLSVYNVNNLAQNIVTTNMSGTNINATNLRVTNFTGTNSSFTNLNATNINNTNFTGTTLSANTMSSSTATLDTINTNIIHCQRIGTGIIFQNTTGATLSPLAYYEEFSSTAFTMQGAWVAPTNTTIRIVRVGTNVTLTMPAVFHAAPNNATLVSTLAISAQFRPLELISQIISIVDNGGISLGRFQIGTNGIITIVADNGSAGFTTPGDAGLEYGVTISWSLSP